MIPEILATLLVIGVFAYIFYDLHRKPPAGPSVLLA